MKIEFLLICGNFFKQTRILSHESEWLASRVVIVVRSWTSWLIHYVSLSLPTLYRLLLPGIRSFATFWCFGYACTPLFRLIRLYFSHYYAPPRNHCLGFYNLTI